MEVKRTTSGDITKDPAVILAKKERTEDRLEYWRTQLARMQAELSDLEDGHAIAKNRFQGIRGQSNSLRRFLMSEILDLIEEQELLTTVQHQNRGE